MSSPPSPLVGPPDPVSNIRPAIYSSARPTLPSIHPYSSHEFPPDGEPAQIALAIQREALDHFNHSFWKLSNMRFQAAEQRVLNALPPNHSPSHREQALARFRQAWLASEAPLQAAYTKHWRSRNFRLVSVALRSALRRVLP
ncbi:hypothetical protein SISNIDRAFT_546017 [Sistotremastrum niveocremeum HHB9708]|uniref:Uncharacterized protein n=2 Tax=Sistotremastraceae TaxID=3402574 RepID=A0A165ALE5_9AGAM|nr:hypothetical protein SISNIDRAFT_546017 [Sistotremastrum niveocremeum HHB9708]KZT42040.1 hypothetical protein SISSUDRAFT_1125970 [Sistotremastrum suecicum HHB10207 ss-3]